MRHCKRLSVILKIGNVVLQIRVTVSSVGRGRVYRGYRPRQVIDLDRGGL